MNKLTTAAIALIALAAPALADDAADGQKVFNKCKACHAIVAADGTAVVKGGKTGPNLFGVVGRTMGSEEGFKYGASLTAAKEKGLVWTEAELIDYVQDPTAHMKKVLADDSAKANMTFKLSGSKAAADAAKVVAFLATNK